MRFVALALLAACSGGGEAPKPKEEAPKPAAPAELHVYIWTNYHSDEAVKRFEQANNAKVTLDTYDNNEVIEQKLQSGTAPYDIVVPTEYMVSSLTKQGLLLPLDETKLPGLKNVDARLDPLKKEGEPRHGVPYLWGTTGLAYRADKITDPVDSWAVAFDAKHKGRIVMLDDMREVFGAALRLEGKSINTTEDAALEAAKKRLVAQKPLLLAYDSSDFAGKIQAGDAWVVQGYSGELASVARESNGTIKYLVPKEGGTLAVDHLAIPKAAKNVELAYKFIDFMLDPDVAAETTNVTGYATANSAARAKIKPEILSDVAVYPPEDVIAKCETLQDLGEATPKLDAMWTEVKAE
ncbi:MAG: polyamine ABC transporter substrate-binding protein [Myxococcota bacterium]